MHITAVVVIPTRSMLTSRMVKFNVYIFQRADGSTSTLARSTVMETEAVQMKTDVIGNSEGYCQGRLMRRTMTHPMKTKSLKKMIHSEDSMLSPPFWTAINGDI